MITVRNRIILYLVLAVVAVLLLISPACSSDTTQDILRREASSRGFSLVGWHLANVPEKLASSISGLGAVPPPEERKVLLDEFFALQAQIAELERQLAIEMAQHGVSPVTEALEAELRELRLEHRSLAPQAELIIEREITHVLAAHGFGFRLARGHFIFPPALFVFQPAPHMLVLSPRDRIQLLGYELLSPVMTVSEFEMVEDRIAAQYDNLSAIVASPGGLASYPSIVDEGARFYRTLYVVAHEWVHQYLIFYPLGRAWFQGGVARQINETVADIVGYEVADEIYRRYGYEPPSRHPPPTDTGFDFAAEMRETRLVTGQLLEEGRIEEAEQYMEERRQLFVQERYYIRRINQAYFAIRDPYPLSPASLSPIGEQLEELRGYYDSLSEFVAAVRGLTTHEQLLALLGEQRT
ncbi:MAG: hypothetical protein IBX67_02955 [Dehalococcoidia bacterium]|nr:hypothetical protein [Dehalococcoidia bacterium]